MSAQTRLDALMLALTSHNYWIANHIAGDGTRTLRLVENSAGQVGDEILGNFAGTQDEVLDQLIAYQVAERLGG